MTDRDYALTVIAHAVLEGTIAAGYKNIGDQDMAEIVKFSVKFADMLAAEMTETVVVDQLNKNPNEQVTQC